MKKFLTCSTIILSFVLFVSCQSGNKQENIENGEIELLTLGGVGMDVGNYIIPVSNGGYAVAGYFSTPDGNGYRGVITRLNQKKEVLWTKTYGESGDNRAWSLAEAEDGGFVVAGFSDGPGSLGPSDVWLFKIDHDGNVLWEKMLGGAKDDLAWEIIKTRDGNYAVAAQTESLGGGGIDAWLITLDDQGNILWDQSYGTAATERVFGITEDFNGNLLACGIYLENDQSNIDIYTLSVNGSTGRTNWKDILDKGGDDTGHGITTDQNGNIWIAGYTNSIGAGGQDGFIAKYADREVSSFFTYGGNQDDRIMNIRFNTKGELFYVGYSNSGSAGQQWDVWTGQTSVSGDSIRDTYYGSTNNDRGVHLLIEEDQMTTVGMIGSPENNANMDLAIISFDLSKNN